MTIVPKFYPAGKLSGELDTNSNYIKGLKLPFVTIGPDSLHDIVPDNSAHTSTALTDAIDLLMTRSGGKGGTILISGTVDWSSGSTLNLNHASGGSSSVIIQGLGTALTKLLIPASTVGINIQNLGNSAYDGLQFRDLTIMGPSKVSRATVGIGSDHTECCVYMQNIRVYFADIGIDLNSPMVYNNSFRDIKTIGCKVGFKISGNHNLLEQVLTGYDQVSGTDGIGIYASGQNTLISCDGGGAHRALELHGYAPHVIDFWTEPGVVEALKMIGVSGAHIDGIHMQGQGQDIILSDSHSNVLDVGFSHGAEDKADLTIEAGCYNNHISRYGFTDFNSITDNGSNTFLQKRIAEAAKPTTTIGIRIGDICTHTDAAAGEAAFWQYTAAGWMNGPNLA
jgi:hypothetical protein